MTGDSAWFGQSREPTLTTDGKLCQKEILSNPPMWSQRQPNSLVREELWREVNLAAQRMGRHPVDTLPQDPNRGPVPMRLYFKQSDFMACGTSGGRAQGHTERGISNSCRGRTREDRRRACRVGDAPTGRALKGVRFAVDRVEDDAQMLEPTPESAPSNFPTEAASSSPAATPSTDTAQPASAADSPDQVMTEGTSSAPDAAVRLSMKRSSDSSHSESETKRHHSDHSTHDVVRALNSVMKSVVGKRRFLSM